MTRMTSAELDAFLHREFPQVDRQGYRVEEVAVTMAPRAAATCCRICEHPASDSMARSIALS